MQDHRPAREVAARRTFRSCLLASLCAALLSGAATVAWGQGNNTAVITGAERVLIRRGPGTKFPPFAALTAGTSVEVQEMQGEWSRVKTASGEVGYVHSTFLALPDEAERAVPATPAVRLTAQPTPRPTAGSDTAALNALTEKNKALEGQVRELQAELTGLKSRTPPPTEPAPTVAACVDAADMRAELKRLTAAVEGLQPHASGNAPAGEGPAAGSAATEPPEHGVSPTALLLGAGGLLTGWILGAAYGRNQDRGRRTRIRF